VRFYAITYRFLSTPKQFQTYLFDSVPSLIFATLALANPHNALLVRFFASLRFTSCVACQRFAIASPIDATRCFSSARRFYAFPSHYKTNHYIAYAFPLFSFGSLGFTILLRCLDSLCVASTKRCFSILWRCFPHDY